ncbi:hypothetical protein HRbin32_01993 [bacterium HR32]|nr:hypothetical protein HRbin32_01993 [bacterium HR32]
MQVGDRFQAVLAADVGGDVGHGPGPEQGDHGHDVLDARRPQFLQVPAHARGLQLEHAGGLPPAQEGVGPLVVQGDLLQVDALAALALHDLQGGVQDGEVGEAQEVELHQADGGHAVHVVLGHDHVVLAPGEGDQVGEGVPGDDDAGRVGAGVAGHPLQLAGQLQQASHPRVLLRLLPQLRVLLQRLVQSTGGRDALGDPVHLPVAHAQHPAHVPHGLAGLHGAEGDDLGHPVVPVLVHHVPDDLVPPGVHEVHVDVRQGVALQVEEAVEGQAVGDGVHVRDPAGVQDQRPRRGTAHGGEDPAGAGEVHEVLHDEEVRGVAHLLDDAELVVQALLQLRGDAPELPAQALLAQVAEVGLRGEALGHGEVREPGPVELDVRPAALRDLHGVPDGLGELAEQRGHLLRALQVEVRDVAHAGAVGVVHRLVHLHAHEDVLRLGVLGHHVVHVVGGHEREVQVAGDAHELGDQGALLGQALVLQLDEELPGLEQVAERCGHLPGALEVSPQDALAQLAVHAAR